MDYAEQFLELFRGSQKIYGVARLTGKVSSVGKREARYSTKHKEVSVVEWRSHLQGEKGVGCAPLNNESMVRWGAIDVDEYKIKVADIAKEIEERSLPLVPCFSKSMGAHLYLFTKEWVPAKDMVATLEAIASVLGLGKSEIFPKQTMLSNDGKGTDVGNWINMPYFGGDRAVRYAVKPNGTSYDLSSFFKRVDEVKLTTEQLEEYQKEDVDPFPDFPPCLNEIFKQKIGTARNVTLSNLAVAFKKEDEENWKTKLEEANRLFVEPLSNKEVDNITKSYDKKDYRYQCRKEPLCHYCNTALCRARKHGVGADGPVPGDRSLTKVDTDPPIWYLDMHKPDGSGVRISLETDELRKPDLFEKRVMETVGSLPPIYKKNEWYEVVNHLMDNMTVIHVPKELTPTGVFIDLLHDFLTNRTAAENSEWSNLLRGNPHKDEQYYYYRAKDFKAYLASMRFTELKLNQQTAVLNQELKATKVFRTINGKGTNLVRIPATFDDVHAEYTLPELEEEDAF